MVLDGFFRFWMVAAFFGRLWLVLARNVDCSLKIWLELDGTGWFCSDVINFGSFRIVVPSFRLSWQVLKDLDGPVWCWRALACSTWFC